MLFLFSLPAMPVTPAFLCLTGFYIVADWLLLLDRKCGLLCFIFIFFHQRKAKSFLDLVDVFLGKIFVKHGSICF